MCLTLAKSDFQITPRFSSKIRNKSEFCCIALMEFHHYSIGRATEKEFCPFIVLDFVNR